MIAFAVFLVCAAVLILKVGSIVIDCLSDSGAIEQDGRQ